MGKIILSCFLLVFVLMFTPLAEAGQEINGCPVPDNLKIIEPDSNVVPPKLALLSGIWEGNRSSRSVIFIVEQIKSNEAVVVEAWTGQKKRYGASINPGFRRVTCPIEQDDDGNYRIIFAVESGTQKLIQTNDPKNIRVLSASTDTIFRKKEMK